MSRGKGEYKQLIFCFVFINRILYFKRKGGIRMSYKSKVTKNILTNPISTQGCTDCATNYDFPGSLTAGKIMTTY